MISSLDSRQINLQLVLYGGKGIHGDARDKKHTAFNTSKQYTLYMDHSITRVKYQEIAIEAN